MNDFFSETHALLNSVSILLQCRFNPNKCFTAPRQAILPFTINWKDIICSQSQEGMLHLPQQKRYWCSCSQKNKETVLRIRSVCSLTFLKSSSRSVTCILFSTSSAIAMKTNITGSVCSHLKMSSTAHKNQAIFISTAGDLYYLSTACALLGCSYWFNK